MITHFLVRDALPVDIRHNAKIFREKISVWAQKKLVIKVCIFRILSNKELWCSKHAVSRSDGTIPLSPVSLGVGVYKAVIHSTDQDIILSMIDDAMRRMMVTLPRIR